MHYAHTGGYMAAMSQVRHYIRYINMFRVQPGAYMLLLRVLEFFLCVSVVTGDYCAGHFDRCICTEEQVVCRNQSLTDITKLYPYIKDNVARVIITGSHFDELPQNFLGFCAGEISLQLKKLDLLDISGNKIRDVHGKSFHCMKNLKTLNLSYNIWEVDFHEYRKGYFTSLPELVTLDMTDAFDELWDGSVHIHKLEIVFNNTDMKKLEVLKLARNELWTFVDSAAASLCLLPSLKHLDLSHNHLGKPVFHKCMTNLEFLDLSENMIPVLPREFMDTIDQLTNLKEIHLENNPFQCDCALLDSYHWIVNNDKIKHKDLLTCYEGFHSSYIGKPVTSLSPSDLTCTTYNANAGSTATKVIVGIIFTIIGCALIGFMYIYRRQLGHLFGGWKKRLPQVSLLPHAGNSSVREESTIENVYILPCHTADKFLDV